MRGKQTSKWFERAEDSMVHGVSSGFRYWGDDDTPVIARGSGGHVFDMDGVDYIDYQLGFGPVILGHGDQRVVDQVTRAASNGTVFAMTQQVEIEAAETIMRALRWPAKMRFTNTGTEATMHAIRLARGWGARDIILKFEGAYHGAHDYVLYTTAGAPASHLGSRLRPLPIQASSGIPDQIRTYIRTLPYNDTELLEDFFTDHGHDIAAVIVEPMAGNFLGILPEPGFLQAIRRLCDEHETVLIFDEVKTGFRIGLGGAVEKFGVEPDIATYAKAMGNGFPVAAIALADKMVEGWELGGIAQAGTYSGNAVAAAAAKATIEALEDGSEFTKIEMAGTALMEGLQKVIDSHGIPGCVIGHPSMFSVFLGEGTPKEYRDLARHDARVYNATIMEMIDRGVMPCPDAREPWFVCGAHSADDVSKTLEVFDESLTATLARAGSLPSVYEDE